MYIIASVAKQVEQYDCMKPLRLLCRHWNNFYNNNYYLPREFSDVPMIVLSFLIFLSSTDGSLNLAASYNRYNGRLEIYINNRWGTVCNNSFGKAEADVACRQLGYTEANSYGSAVEMG